MTFPQSRSVRQLAAYGLLAVALVACSTSGKSSDRADTTTTTGAPTSTTTATDSTTTTTEPSSADISVEDLEELLPTADDLGGSYEVDTSEESSSSDNEMDEALADACPEVMDLIDDDDDRDEEDAAVSFTDADDRGFEVALKQSSDFDSDELDEMVDAVNTCETISYTDDDGLEYTIDLSADRTDEFGDASVVMFIDIILDMEELPRPLEISAVFQTFVVGPVSVKIMAMDGVDGISLEPVPTDLNLVDELAEEMETRVTDLLAG